VGSHGETQARLFGPEDECESDTVDAEILDTLRFPWWASETRTPMAAPVDMFAAPPAPVEKFGSGASAKWDFLGYAFVDAPVGVTATELRLGVIDHIVAYLDRGGRVFVDSGAFGAFRAGRQLDFEREVFTVYDDLLRRTLKPHGLMIVMPDVVGDQQRTLWLQRQHLAHIRRWLDSGAECVFPIQDPTLDPVVSYHDVRALISGRAFTVGVPSNEHAWHPYQVIEFARAAKPSRMHLLGLAREAVLQQISSEVSAISPHTRLSADSCQIIAHAGRGRRLTDRCKTRLEDAVLWVEGGAREVPLPDLSTYLTDVLYTPDFLGAQAAVKLGEALGYSGDAWRAKFAAAAPVGMLEVLGSLDPDEEWLHDRMRNVVRELLYRPWLRKVLSGPIRAYEVARIASGGDPEASRGPASSGRCAPATSGVERAAGITELEAACV
jgi:hypothetical protein